MVVDGTGPFAGSDARHMGACAWVALLCVVAFALGMAGVHSPLPTGSGSGLSPLSTSPPLVQLSVFPSLPSVGESMEINATVVGGVPPYSFNWSGLPPGCPSPRSPIVVCTPTEAGIYVVNLTVSDAQAGSPPGFATTTVDVVPGVATLGSDILVVLGVIGGVALVGVIVAAFIYRRGRPPARPPGSGDDGVALVDSGRPPPS